MIFSFFPSAMQPYNINSLVSLPFISMIHTRTHKNKISPLTLVIKNAAIRLHVAKNLINRQQFFGQFVYTVCEVRSTYSGTSVIRTPWDQGWSISLKSLYL